MPEPRWSAAQVAARLGVRTDTLYAYVSRGLLQRDRDERGRSTFDPMEVERFAAARRRPAAPGAMSGRPLMVLESPITLVEPDRLLFRGVPADRLVALGFERAVAHLWQTLPAPFHVDAAVAGAIAGLPDLPSAADSMRMAVLAAAAADPFRRETGPAVFAAGSTIIGAETDGSVDTARVAERLWPRLTREPAGPGDIDLLDAALVLGMDHDLAASTMAARVAASARADPYSCVVAALSAFDGRLHGGSGRYAAELVHACIAHGPEAALAAQVAHGRGTPGFGHPVYRRSDPRAIALMRLLEARPRWAAATGAVRALTAVVTARMSRVATFDLALAALAVGAGFGEDAGERLFAVSRTAGWIAHIADEYASPPLRLRPESRYTGPLPAGEHAAAGRADGGRA